MLGACSPVGETGAPQGDDSSPRESVSAVRAQESVDVVRAAYADYPAPKARYDVDAELAPPQEGTVQACEAAPPGETGAARVSVELHHPNDRAGLGTERDARSPEVSAVPVGDATLMWARPGSGCTQTQKAPHQYFDGGWHHLDVVSLEGYLLGVDPDDPAGDGLELQ